MLSRRTGATSYGLALFASMWCGGCSGAGFLDPGMAFPEVVFHAPVVYEVHSRDSLAAIAKDMGVSLGDLRAWNGLDTDVLEIGQELLVWRFPEAPEEKVAVSRAPVKPRPRSVRSRTPALVITQTPVVVSVSVPEGERQKIEVGSAASVRGSGILGSLDNEALSGGLDDALSDDVASLGRAKTVDRGLGLSSRSLANEGTAETVDIDRTPGTYGPHVPSVAVRPPSLKKPAAKRCLAGPDARDLTADEGYLASKGLTADQIRPVMAAFVRHTASCIPRGTRGTFIFQAEITVGCDGRVSGVWVSSDGGLPNAVSSCVATTLEYASFPAHALPDGVTFSYPIQYAY